MEIITDRLVLRAFFEKEAAILSDMFGNWDVSQYFWTPPYPYMVGHAVDYISTMRADHARGVFNHFAIAKKDDGVLIGGISLDIDPAPEWKDEVSYWIGKPFWGQGYASEALRAVVDYAKNMQKRSRLWAVPDKENMATIKVLEKSGFTFREDILRTQPSRTGSMTMSKYQIDF